MTDKLSLFNSSLRELGERSIVSLTEQRAPRRYLDTAWGNGAFVKEVLGRAQWVFGRRSVQMNPDTDLATNFGLAYAYRAPTDFVRTCAMCVDPNFVVPLTQYETENGVFYAAVQPLYLKYISSDASYGGNLATWPENFSIYAAKLLASRILANLTGNKADRDGLTKDVERALLTAKNSDAMEEPTKFAPPGRFVSARMRGRTGTWDHGVETQLTGG